METKAMTQTVRNWLEMVAAVKADPNATDHERRCVVAVEMAITAACANNGRISVEELPYNLPGQRLTVDLPVA